VTYAEKVMMSSTAELTAARDTLRTYIDTTGCNACRAYAANIHKAVEELIGLHERGEEFVRYTEECEMLKRIMVEGNVKQQTDDSENE